MSIDYTCLLLCATMAMGLVGLLASLATRIAKKLEPLRNAHTDAEGRMQ
jgi:hypothetical protein